MSRECKKLLLEIMWIVIWLKNLNSLVVDMAFKSKWNIWNYKFYLGLDIWNKKKPQSNDCGLVCFLSNTNSNRAQNLQWLLAKKRCYAHICISFSFCADTTFHTGFSFVVMPHKPWFSLWHILTVFNFSQIEQQVFLFFMVFIEKFFKEVFFAYHVFIVEFVPLIDGWEQIEYVLMDSDGISFFLEVCFHHVIQGFFPTIPVELEEHCVIKELLCTFAQIIDECWFLREGCL